MLEFRKIDAFFPSYYETDILIILFKNLLQI